MSSNTRDIKRRIKSVTNTRQITRAMQLVATSKMKKAQKRSQEANPYAQGALNILNHLTQHLAGSHFHPFWEQSPVNAKVGLILISADRGFCGGLNINLFNAVLPLIKDHPHDLDIVSVGKKGRDFARRMGMPISADFSGIGDHFTMNEVTPIAHIATQGFIKQEYREVYIAYTDFVNTILQRPVVRKLLPIDISIFEQIAEVASSPSPNIGEGGVRYDVRAGGTRADYIFEPSPETVFQHLIPYLIEVLVYKALLDSRASEHSARMIAMKNATDRAGEMISDLQLAYNQARQANITREIAEISAGAMATV
ncbi:MAG: ATP synthase F1 subunit gamma [Candidatus Jacksonbacteria bacterium RIFCSPLOWO2_02_FULL_43_9]|nr:MAG: ATP synthase gamma chain [Parcubacteria group bacterium GW2011_GWA2_43_13]OGY68630.1 MAG: ATP synthase F1 subunit gamma [Candidatus Jacksonbacteria bacterium RIFCSPHIGHO2_02_FULL_43_10]OGY70119.1 MAG: ATP synthase F1 subunit gamma [Candidatus Jacksonbacteria bacterium RIFCSPLOWO2_01_FULL_44_13]OGY73899.1 MAG: ATP synthase F1 subunit gamma [Candidatus Jacksonbacteria bacterium RIFCSPLOWO2_02_FULL_43_9]HAZ16442.1 ATP synthase F1 subunit gamma [Candidatus Jacksonbacteria bacterium]